MSELNTIEELNDHLRELIEQQDYFIKCKELRLTHTNKCYNNILDNGHQIYIDLIDKGITKCEKVITTIQNLIEKKIKEVLTAM
jgi:hypothetical protein